MMDYSTPSSLPGEYYLEAVRETASGFKLNRDSSFEFFFSYGALDRTGTGRWKLENNTVVFNSDTSAEGSFALLGSRRTDMRGIAIHIAGANSQLAGFVRALAGGVSATARNDVWIYLNIAKTDSIELVFELCPDKKFMYRVTDPTHNRFEFKLEPSIAMVVFNNFALQVFPDKLSGPHPLMPGRSFTYRKSAK